MNNFTMNFNNLMNELETNYTKALHFNDNAKVQEMFLLRVKAKAYQNILKPLKYDTVKQNKEVSTFYNKLTSFINNTHEQVNIVFEKAGV